MNNASKTKLIDKIKGNKKLQIILAIIIAILFVVIMFSGKKSSDTIRATSDQNEYVSSLENQLSDALSQVEGVGKVSVVITLESGMETIIAMKTVTEETASGKRTETTPILVNGKTVTLREDYPKIKGVLVVAKGANNISVINKILQAINSLLDVDLNKIEILSMK